MKRIGMSVLFAVLLAAMPLAQAAATDVTGEWDLTTLSPVGESTNTVEFKKDGEAWKAIAKSPQGERPYDSVAVDGDKVTLVLTIDFQGQPMTITYLGTVADKSINGSADFGGLAMGSFSATRKVADPPK
ncbi:MAG TPA: hypothetical protein VM032_02565 [Vicinamibacterales bacterium]|nr:hypothetical protein [Vicinamibacterales bacterium]